MSITPPSFSYLKGSKPRIYVLEVRDRHKPDGDPIAWLLVEREEKHERNENGELLSAAITFYYVLIEEQKTPQEGGSFSGSYVFTRHTDSKKVSVTNTAIQNGGVFVDPEELRGHRVGTYLQNEVIKWLQQWPDAEVHPIKLEKETNNLERDRRNAFWESFGFEFDYYDDGKRTGRSRPTSPKKLKNRDDSWKKNIKELCFIDHLKELRHENTRQKRAITELERLNKNLMEHVNSMRNKPRWAAFGLVRRGLKDRLRKIFFCVIAILVALGIITWLKNLASSFFKYKSVFLLGYPQILWITT